MIDPSETPGAGPSSTEFDLSPPENPLEFVGIDIRDWNQSEEMADWEPAEEGLFWRLLIRQPIKRTLPADEVKLAALARLPLKTFRKLWQRVASCFESVEINGEMRLFNRRMAVAVAQAEKARDSHRLRGQKGGQNSALARSKVQPKRKHSLSTGEGQLEHSSSNASKSLSLSSSVVGVKASGVEQQVEAQARRLAEGRKNFSKMQRVTTESVEFYAKTISAILAKGEHGMPQIVGVVNYLASPDGLREWEFGLCNQRNTYKHALIGNFPSILDRAREWAEDHEPEEDFEDYDNPNPDAIPAGLALGIGGSK